MAEVCITRNAGITGNELTIQPWTVPRTVYDQSFASTGDGTYDQLTTPPGRLMIDTGIQSWTNTGPLEARILIRIQRDRREWLVSNPNAVQIRDRYTTATGTPDPRIPDTSSVYNGQSGASLDIGTAFTGTPLIGRYWEWEDGTLLEDWHGPVPSGEPFKFWYRAYLWTPPPWSNNANGGNPEHSASIHGVRVQLMAFPVQDTEVIA